LKAGHDVCVVDNLSNSKTVPLERIQELSGRDLEFYCTDLAHKDALSKVFDSHSFDAAIHFAGFKAVGESVLKPLKYYWNNIAGTLVLLELMNAYGVQNIVFSSSATVYGEPDRVPIKETFPVCPTNPYGQTKLHIEHILRDLYTADQNWNIAILRYFNPVGAHPSGLIGEDPNDIPNNLMPFISQVAVGKQPELSVYGNKQPELSVYGNDYPTPDGTGVRDYIHVMDLTGGHICALEKLQEGPGLLTYNLGTGQGYSVLEMISAFEKMSGQSIPYKIASRREGDIAICYADPSLAEAEMGWRAELDISAMCRDTWRWQSKNPDGYI